MRPNRTANTDVSGPTWSTISYTFAPGKHHKALQYTWYDGVSKDGGHAPPDEVLDGCGMAPNVAVSKFDLVMIGEKGKLFFKRSNVDMVTNPASLVEEYADTPKTIARVKDEDAEWIAACKGGPTALSNFDYSGPLTEFVLLGNLAIRAGQKIDWDGENMKATNCPAVDPFVRRQYRKGWEL